ncbi:alpha/beta-hydrolase [Aureobasidium sp. EXF-10728]|nr:alpha/beta-hydrolase [Aureobasidium sp. EXF-10728]
MATAFPGQPFSSQSAEYHESTHARYWTDVPYERTRLNLLDICVPKRQPEDSQQAVWLVYIHGGAWRDPMIDRKSFSAALDMLLEDNQPHNVAGFVSLDYRLSPYPSHPTSPSSPDDDSRNVQHPEHLNDILAALFFLGANTGEEIHLRSGETVRLPDTRSIMAGRYVLCGHSCGATLAMQATALLSSGPGATQPPAALLGMEGIYDLAALVATHTHPAYREFVTAAFSEDEKTWDMASQLCCRLQNWRGNVWLIQSVNDELVDMQQTDSMVDKLVMQGFTKTTTTVAETESKQVSKIVINCLHDEVWEKGTELAKAIRAVIDQK